MFLRIMWCYIFILTLLDISLINKHTAQGKSHGVTDAVHDTLLEGVTFQEWGKESESDGAGAGAGAALQLSPAALQFGRAALAAAHARTVTVTNGANTTVHLASVAGTTQHFHASFFQSKTLAPGENTTFSVVYLGRGEGPVAAHLYIHTSLGVHRYPVSAVGVASEWHVWPLLGLRVPHAATLEPLLTLYNPTDRQVQVTEVYSSASWLGLQLPESEGEGVGSGGAARELWSLPPYSARPLVRLRIQPPPPPPHSPHAQHSHTAYIRIKADIPGGGLVVCVEARREGSGGGEHWQPVQLRLGTRGAGDPPHSFPLHLANSAGEPRRLAPTGLWDASCALLPPPVRAPPDLVDVGAGAGAGTAPHLANGARNGAGVGAGPGTGTHEAEAAQCAVVRDTLRAHQPHEHAATLTLHYRKLWASVAGDAGGAGAAEEAWCAGWVRGGRAALHYSVRLVPGTLALAPAELHLVTSLGEGGARELRLRNQFLAPVRLLRVEYPPRLDRYIQVEWLGMRIVDAGEECAWARVGLRAPLWEERGETVAVPADVAAAELTLRTNVTTYSVPLRIYSGKLDIEWEWEGAGAARLELGAVRARAELLVAARVRNAGSAALCGVRLGAALPGAHFALLCRNLTEQHCECIPGGEWRGAELRVRAGERGAAARGVRGAVWARSQYARTLHHVTLHPHPHARHMSLRLRALHDDDACASAPFAWWERAVEVWSETGRAARVLAVSLAPTAPAHAPALRYSESSEVVRGVGGTVIGLVQVAPELLCEPLCYAGLQTYHPEWEAWAGRACLAAVDWLPGDLALLRERVARYAAAATAGARDVTVTVRTEYARRLRATARVGSAWPRLVCAGAEGAHAGLAALGAGAPLLVRVHNPSRSHPVLVQARLHPRSHPPHPRTVHLTPAGGVHSAHCAGEPCAWAEDAFQLREWSATRGEAAVWDGGVAPAGGGADSLPVLRLAPGAEVQLLLQFTPTAPTALTTYLYIRNNLTILEAVVLSGRGAVPQFELANRRPGSATPLQLDVKQCPPTVRRSVAVRNGGAVPVRVLGWRVGGASGAGDACEARGFAVHPCAPLTLAPNASRRIEIAFTADATLALVRSPLHVITDHGVYEYALSASVCAAALGGCGARPSGAQPHWDGALRGGGITLAVLVLCAALALAALDAERLLRAARAARAARLAHPHLHHLAHPLDLNRPPDPHPAPPAPAASASLAQPPHKRKRAARRATSALDPAAERRAFERWRAEMERRDAVRPRSTHRDDEDERDSDDADRPPPLGLAASHSPQAPLGDTGARTSADEDAPSTGTDSDAPPETGAGGEADASLSPSPSPSPSPERYDAGPQPNMDGAPHEWCEEPEPERPCETTPPRRSPFPGGDVLRRRRDPVDVVRPDIGTSRRGGGSGGGGGGSTALVKHHTRRDKGVKRRERPPATSARGSPLAMGGSSCVPVPAPAPAPPPAPSNGAVRVGATWSSVVAAKEIKPEGGVGAALAPIGSAVARRGGAVTTGGAGAATDNSLFFFNGASSSVPPASAVPAPAPTVPEPGLDQYTWPQAHIDYRGGSGGNGEEGGGAYGTIGSVWSGATPRWVWGQYETPLASHSLGCVGDVAVRPPPGFAAPASASAPAAVPGRVFDPFHSLSSIWAPSAAAASVASGSSSSGAPSPSPWRRDTAPAPSDPPPH